MRDLLAPMVYVMAFVAVFLVIQVVAGLVMSSSDQSRRVNRRLTMLASGMKPDEVYSALVRSPGALKTSSSLLNRLQDSLFMRMKQAGLRYAPARLLLTMLLVAGALWAAGLALLTLRNQGAFASNLLVTLAGALLLTGAGSWMWLERKRKKRLRQLEEQLPLALDIVTRAIRAGHPVVSAVQLASAELGDPIGSEFGLIVDETTYGLEFREALVSFARRTGSSDAHFFAVSVGIQSETGGNLAEILEGLAAVVRSRQTLAKRVKALSSEGKASAMILSLLPLFLVGVLMLFQPRFYTEKFSDPIFWPVISMVLVVYGIGQVMIKRITDIKY